MGSFSWLNPSNEERATKLIETGLAQLKMTGLFDFDPLRSAQQVRQYATSRLPKTNMRPDVLASSWLVIFVLASKQSREERLPFANVALALLQVAIGDPLLRLSSVNEKIAERAFWELTNKFFNDNSVSANFAQASSSRDVIPMGGATSIDCITAEHGYLSNVYGSNGEWASVGQSVVHEDGRTYDKMDIVFKNGEGKTVWFDITDSWKSWAAATHTPPQHFIASSERQAVEQVGSTQGIATPVPASLTADNPSRAQTGSRWFGAWLLLGIGVVIIIGIANSLTSASRDTVQASRATRESTAVALPTPREAPKANGLAPRGVPHVTSAQSYAPAERIAFITKQTLRADGTLTEAQHAEFWREMHKLSGREQGDILQMMRVNLLGAYEYQIALWDSALISSRRREAVKTGRLEELEAGTRTEFLESLPSTLSNEQREAMILEYDQQRSVSLASSSRLLLAAATGQTFPVSDHETIRIDPPTVLAITETIRATSGRIARLMSPVGLTEAAELNSESWPTTSAWVKELPKGPQTVVVGTALDALAAKVSELQRNAKSPDDVLWTVKILACGHMMAEGISTNNHELQGRLKVAHENFSDLISGKVSGSDPQFLTKGRNTSAQVAAFLASVEQVTLRDTRTQYARRLEETSKSFVVYSMACASR